MVDVFSHSTISILCRLFVLHSQIRDKAMILYFGRYILPQHYIHTMSIVCSSLSDLGQSDDVVFWEIPSPAALYPCYVDVFVYHSQICDKAMVDAFSRSALPYCVDCLVFTCGFRTKR